MREDATHEFTQQGLDCRVDMIWLYHIIWREGEVLQQWILN